MNYLQMCNELRREMGSDASPIVDVTTQTSGDSLRVVRWINLAWLEIQAQRLDWNFMWREFSEVLTAGASTYDLRTAISPTTTVRLLNKPFIAAGTFGKRRVVHMDYPMFYEEFAASTPQPGIPYAYTILPDYRVRFDCELSQNITLTGEYNAEAQSFAANIDTTPMEEKYDMAVVYRALRKYAGFDEASEVGQWAREMDNMYSDMMIRELTPKMLIGANSLA